RKECPLNSGYLSAFLTVYIVSPAFAFFSFQIPFISQCKTTPSVICGGEAMKSMDKISTGIAYGTSAGSA
ncbi:TPA: hypothetical protein ACHXKX_004641, partial [Shigella sonnei]